MSIRILLSGNEIIDVSKETAKRVDSEWKDTEIRPSDPIEINGRSIKKSRIVEVGNPNQRNDVYDLSNSEDKQIIREFEKELLDCESYVLDREIEYYGSPVKVIKAVNNLPEKTLSDGFIQNDILGLCKWTLVKYCLDSGYIIKQDFNWFASPKYSEYLEKKKSLDELNSKRDYAQRKELEDLEKCVNKF